MESASSDHLRIEQWGRLPKRKERLGGLSRTVLLGLVYAGYVKSAVIRKPGSQRAIRLIHIPSLLRYLDSVTEPPPPDDTNDHARIRQLILEEHSPGEDQAIDQGRPPLSLEQQQTQVRSLDEASKKHSRSKRISHPRNKTGHD